MKFFVLTIILLLLTSVFIIAQPVPPDQPEPVPITGIEYLLIGGGAYGIYRFQKKRKKKDQA